MNLLTKAADRISAILPLFLLSLSAISPVIAQTPHVEPLQATARCEIRLEIFNIDGRTRVDALKNLIGSAEGLEFSDSEDLERFAEERARKLEKLRIFRESSVSVKWVENGDGSADRQVADLVVNVRDGAPIIPIPYAFYNSNDGLQAGTILNMPNLAGSLQNLFMVGLYSAPPDESDALQWTNPNFMFFSTLSGIEAGPVSIFLAGSAMRMNREIEYRGVSGATFKTTALSGTIGFTRRFGDKFSDTLSFRAGGSPSSELVTVDDAGLLEYGPIEFAYSVKNEVAVDSFNWEGNFREGWKAQAGISWERSKPKYADADEWITAESEAAFYGVWGIFNPGVSVYGFAKTGKPELDMGMRTRGVRNGELAGNYGAFLRSGVQTRIARFKSAEIDVAPAVDLFWVRVPGDDDHEDDYGAAVGAEVLFLFDAMKSLPIKLGFAWDCRPEDQIASGKRLEVDFSFSLSY